MHFIFHCPKYTQQRNALYEQIERIMSDFLNYNDVDKLKILMKQEYVNIFSNYLYRIYKLRNSILYK